MQGAGFRGYRFRHHRCSSRVTAKLTAAPMAARAAVRARSYSHGCPATLSNSPPPVPMLSCRLLVFITSSLRVAHTTFQRLEHAQRQCEVLCNHHHLGR